MKTNEEVNTIKEEVEVPNTKLDELTEEEFALVSGGTSVECDKNYAVTPSSKTL